MHEHLFVALTLDKVLESSTGSAETSLACFRHAVNSQRASALKAIQVIVRRQTRLSMRHDELKQDAELQTYRCIFKVLEQGVSAEDASAETIKKCLMAFNELTGSVAREGTR